MIASLQCLERRMHLASDSAENIIRKHGKTSYLWFFVYARRRATALRLAARLDDRKAELRKEGLIT